jgi:hypothetical protein
VPLWCVPSLFFLDRLVRWINAQFMLNHLTRDPRHIRYLQCKDIKIDLEKSDERKFLFGVKVVVDSELLVRVIGIHCNLLVFCLHGSLQLIIHLLISGQWSRGQCNISAFQHWRDPRRIADRWLGCRWFARSTATLCFGCLGNLFLSCLITEASNV